MATAAGQGRSELRLASSGLQPPCSRTLRVGARFEVEFPERSDAADLRRILESLVSC